MTKHINNERMCFELIEFNGYLSGAAEKRFRKKARNLVQNALIVALLVWLPVIVFITVKIDYILLLVVYCAMFVVVPLLVRLPQSKKERRETTPNKIIIDGERLVCVADKYTESKRVSDVKVIYEFKEYYEIIFPFGKLSEKFICQKELLRKGSLYEFEKLFKGKIYKKGQWDDSLVS